MSEAEKPRFRRVVRRGPSQVETRPAWTWRPAEIWSIIRSYVGLGGDARQFAIDSKSALSRFLNERASYVAQVSLYGYLRTRAGMRYPELFDDDAFVASINIAKWHLWLDCLSDLAVYAGSRLVSGAPREAARVAGLISGAVDAILEQTGSPADAGHDFPRHAERVRSRVARTDWLAIGPDDAAFSESPAGLVRWAPIVDELKALDEEIVRNSVRFRWQQVRRDFVECLDAEAVLRESGATDP